MTAEEKKLKPKPHSSEAERAILGAILFEPSEAIKLCLRSNLEAVDFSWHRHRNLYRHMLDMHKDGSIAMDAITISQWLNDRDVIEDIGGYEYLTELQDEKVIPTHCGHYIETIMNKASLRRIIEAGEEMVERAYSEPSAENICADAKVSLLSALKTPCLNESNDSMSRIMSEVDNGMNGVINSIPTPFPDMDKITLGVRRKMVTLLTGRSKSGKSMLKAMWLVTLGQKGIPFLDLCFEDGEDITKMRMAANLGDFKLSLFSGRNTIVHNGEVESMPISSHERNMLAHYLAEVEKLPIYFHEKKCFAHELKGICADYVEEYGIQGVFCDGNKDIKRPSGCYNDTGTDEEISQTQTEIAKELNLAIIAVMHLTKIPADQIITEGSIRGSSNIVSDSRSVYALQNYGLESEATKAGRELLFNEYGNMTTRRFDCVVNNHGQSARMWLDSDLGKCQFWKP